MPDTESPIHKYWRYKSGPEKITTVIGGVIVTLVGLIIIAALLAVFVHVVKGLF